MLRRDLADHLRDLRAIERRRARSTLWCERTLQGGRNSGRAVATRSSGACAAALGQRAHEIERSRVGPVQVLEGEHDRLRPRARQNPGRSSPPVAGGATPLAASFAARSCGQRDVDQRREQRRVFRWSRGRPAQACSRGRRGAVRPAASAPKRWRPHSAIGCSGVFCRSCEERPFDPGVRRLAEPGVKLLDQPRLAEAGLADDQHELALAFARALPAARQQRKLLLAADEGRQRARRRRAGRRRSRERRDRASTGADTPLSSCCALAPRRRRARRPAAGRAR